MTTFSEGSKMVLKGLDATQAHFGVGNTMRSYLGKTLTIAGHNPHNHVVRLVEDGGMFSWFDHDFCSPEEYVEQEIPGWQDSIGLPIDHYCHYNNYCLMDEDDEGMCVWDEGGSCFESFCDYMWEYRDEYGSYPDRMRFYFDFQRREYNGLGNFILEDKEIYRWLYNWKRLGATRVSPKQWADKKMIELPTSMNLEELYLHVCIGRYVAEQPDTIRATFRLMDNYGFQFLPATVAVQLIFGNRSHQMVDICMMHGSYDNYKYSIYQKMAIIATTFWRWIDHLDHRDWDHRPNDGLWSFWERVSDYQPSAPEFWQQINYVTADNYKYWDYKKGVLKMSTPTKKAA